ncbi:hypothetical protein [Mycolicibacterium fortuitum]|uniref:Uncharacterized protein n=1 Tax=Mycolicibacterium fortuitum TaxID=1766 RepID=A0AAE4VKQ3_MYCFO|nr:hypothetical protein [Mycolicibacterium fortuitum]MCV7144236.1 hypothetical protein [Mycolicibacterium fortuitum]MDV7195771.1 hypothetical protein [Mycolicibacterium fortuitum]MDV7209465.1 hypothetical protein [Mycolicibacterium fortuitum]MDV7231312.1 hypothetical protein [Mycolicibacterium fortuitum]MDV7262840.1 hypothetical protein [Mycolicibacterium fortuitum]
MIDTTAVQTVDTHEWEIPAYNRHAFEAAIAKANGKLARAGLDARFEVTYENFEKPAKAVTGVVVTEPWVRATLTGPLKLSHGHYTFVASLIEEEAGVTVHSAPGQELGGYIPNGTANCDHCGVDRNRGRLYLVRDERDGSIVQLGHSCIELYTGVSPKGLWSLTFDEELKSYTEASEGGFGIHDYGASVDMVLAYAFAHSDRGRHYVPTGGWAGTATVAHVRNSLFADINKMKEDDRAYYVAKAVDAAAYAADAELINAIRASVNETGPDSDYGRNLRVILAGEMVSPRNIGILTSLVKVYARQQQIEAERKATPIVAGFIGEVGERIKNIAGVAKTVYRDEGYYGMRTLLVGITDDGHVITWWASKSLDIEVGQRFTIGAATVKNHDNYKGQDQTVLSRPSKFEVCTGEDNE